MADDLLKLLKEPWLWAGAGVVGFMTAWFKGLLKQIFPSPQELLRYIRAWRRPSAPDYKFIILISPLALDDEGNSSTRRVKTALEEWPGLHVRELAAPINADSLMSREDVERRGRALLQQDHGDVLIWGDVNKEDKRVHLRFLQPATASKPVSFGTSELTLIPPFGKHVAAEIAAAALAAVAPATEASGQYLVQILSPIEKRLHRAVETMPSSIPWHSRGSLFHSHALSVLVMGEQTGKSDYLTKAIASFRKALKEYTRERVPLDWAGTQNNLGIALAILGERETGTKRLEEAVAAFREALKERTREHVPLGWAMTQNNLGNALQTLSLRESGTRRLEEAVAAHREALKEYTRERVPLVWAAAHNNLGTALGALGGRETGTKRLEEAVVAFREALKEYTRDRVPLYWAAAQNNLGNTFRELGERESGTTRLEEAVNAYREFLKEYTRERVPLVWAAAHNNLGNALRALGERESGTARLEEAVATFRKALAEYEKAGAGHYINLAQENLSRVEAILAKRRGDK